MDADEGLLEQIFIKGDDYMRIRIIQHAQGADGAFGYAEAFHQAFLGGKAQARAAQLCTNVFQVGILFAADGNKIMLLAVIVAEEKVFGSPKIFVIRLPSQAKGLSL